MTHPITWTEAIWFINACLAIIYLTYRIDCWREGRKNKK